MEEKSIQHLQIHEDNYAATFRQFVERVEQLIVVQEGQIDKHVRQKCDLEARILGLEDNAALQYIVMPVIDSVFK